MKFSLSVVASLLALSVVARPRAAEEGDPLPQKSRVTAFVIDNDGTPSVECWEIEQIVEDMQVKKADGTKATARSLSLASGDDLEGLEILTWPSLSPIWPPGDPDHSLHSQGLDLYASFNLFSVQGGLIYFQLFASVQKTADDDDVETHIFSLENGDDWFYFEDKYTGSNEDILRRKTSSSSPVTISTISATETELLRLRFGSTPSHKVIHKGACSFTGIKTPADSSAREAKTSPARSPFTVQVQIEESL